MMCMMQRRRLRCQLSRADHLAYGTSRCLYPRHASSGVLILTPSQRKCMVSVTSFQKQIEVQLVRTLWKRNTTTIAFFHPPLLPCMMMVGMFSVDLVFTVKLVGTLYFIAARWSHDELQLGLQLRGRIADRGSGLAMGS